MVRCKFSCSFKRETEQGVDLSFAPVYTGSPENEEFFKYTPGGNLSFYTVNKSAAAVFELGKEYYIDIKEA